MVGVYMIMRIVEAVCFSRGVWGFGSSMRYGVLFFWGRVEWFLDGVCLCCRRGGLFASFGYVVDCFAAFVGDVLPVLCCYAVFGEEF